MFDNDDIRYSKAEERPPWELSPGGRIREWFSCRKVDDTTSEHCREVEEQKKARVQAQSHRSASHARLQRQQEEARLRLAREQEAARRRMAEARSRVRQTRTDSQQEPAVPPVPPQDPRGARYTYPQPRRNQANLNRRGKPGHGVLIAVLTIFLITFVVGLVAGFSEDFSDFEEEQGIPTPQIPKVETPHRDEDDADGFSVPWGDGEIPWDSIIPSQDEDAVHQSQLPRVDADGSLSMTIASSEGLQPLSYQELYRRCLPSTVSIKVLTGDGGGTGTGIVMSEDGFILTCNHVIAGGESCTVTTYDDQSYEAKLVGGDAQTDLAVLKIDAEGLVPAQFGDSDKLTVGDEVLAIGDPLGTELRGTLTNGIVSAINRNVTVKSYPMTLIQTTAALNAGNSGGPLINIYGQVVGVNNMKMISSAVTVEGLGFAVPTSVIREIIPILSTEGKVSRPVMGITVYGVDEETAQRADLPTTGLRVASINPASNAEEAGLQIGDYIYAVNGEHMESVTEVKPVLEEAGIGGEVTLTVYRYDDEGEMEELEIVITVMDQAGLK